MSLRNVWQFERREWDGPLPPLLAQVWSQENADSLFRRIENPLVLRKRCVFFSRFPEDSHQLVIGYVWVNETGLAEAAQQRILRTQVAENESTEFRRGDRH